MVSRKLFPPEQWQQIKALFEQASLVPPDQRAAAVGTATDDPEVAREVLALLATHDEATGFLEAEDRALLDPGSKLGPYEIVGYLGGGGMADVYRARDPRLDRSVAVKVLRNRVGDPAARARFQREARAIAALSHSNVLAIYDVGETTQRAYLVTELLEGETLRARIARKRPAITDAIAWTIQIARGLAAAHALGIVHRDLKPENIYLLTDGTLKILDFGLARSSGGDGALDDGVSIPGTILGTVGYLAPEQARGKPVTATADLFAVGAILFELLTGERAFRGETPIDTLRAVLDHEPPLPSTLQREVPAWLDRVVQALLAKDAAARFESARDLVIALQVLGAKAPPTPEPRRRRWPVLLAAAAGILACGAIVAGVWARTAATTTPVISVARPFPLTYSGHDRHPAVSPDGRFLAFTSDREGRSQIWIQQIDVGRETALTDGAGGADSAPRFSPDGSQIMFTRTTEDMTGAALYRVGLLGGVPRKIVDDASDGDWSPDGRQIVFLRSKRDVHALLVAQIDGSGERLLVQLDGRILRGRDVEQRVRWSPDGTRIAISGFRPHPGTPQSVTIVRVDGSGSIDLPTPNRVGLVSAVAWEDPDTILYSQALSVSGNSTGSPARIVRHRISDGQVTTLMWPLESSLVLDRWPGRGIVFDSRSARQHLRELPIAGGSGRRLSGGTQTDRQPRLSPDGTAVSFTSNRGGTNLDVWTIDRQTGVSRRLTDDEADDWDPAFTPDGRHLLWSSNRTGNFEIWMSNADGANPRQITRDGGDAQNPAATPDGAWVIYASDARGRAGVWRVRSDGSDARMLVPDAILPEVSPDGTHVLFVSNADPKMPVIGVARVDNGQILPFEIRIHVHAPTWALLGRARWARDGGAIAYIGQDQSGVTGVYLQDFAADRDTTATRRPLAGFDPTRVVESFDLDDTTIVLAESEPRSAIFAVTDLPPAR